MSPTNGCEPIHAGPATSLRANGPTTSQPRSKRSEGLGERSQKSRALKARHKIYAEATIPNPPAILALNRPFNHSMSENLSPIGFWSYARQDDEEKLSGLRSILQRQLQQKYGREPIRIFQDVAAIPPGADWNQKITEALHSSTFLIPIITPNFLESEWCNQEVFLFLEREQALAKEFPELAGSRRIYPIFYIDITDVEAFDARLLPELRKRQWTNFRDLIYKDDKHESVRLRLDQIAESIVKVLRVDQRAARERKAAAAVVHAVELEDANRKQATEQAQRVEDERIKEEHERELATHRARAEELRQAQAREDAQRIAREAEVQAELEAKQRAEQRDREEAARATETTRFAKEAEENRHAEAARQAEAAQQAEEQRRAEQSRQREAAEREAQRFAAQRAREEAAREAQIRRDAERKARDETERKARDEAERESHAELLRQLQSGERPPEAAASLSSSTAQTSPEPPAKPLWETRLAYAGAGLMAIALIWLMWPHDSNTQSTACYAGNAAACDQMGKTLYGDYDHDGAVAWYRKACDGGDAEGCLDLGGTSQDSGESMAAYSKACDGGQPVGCYQLGYIYEQGKGVTVDDSRAVALYRTACDGGYAIACTHVGYMYEYGAKGVPRDITQAMALYRKDCDAGDALGCVSIKRLQP